LTTKTTVVDNSIIIPAFNRSNEVCDLVEQIVALIESEIPDQTSEIIVVDDGSTDSTAADVAALREAHSITINVVSQKNQGVASARNHGALEARGRVLIYIDSDCVPQSEWLTNISRSVVPGEVAYARVEGDRVPYYPLEVSPLGTKFPGASFAMYRDDYLRLGGMCELFGHHLEDSDFYIKCVEAGIGVNSVQDAVIWHPLRNRSIGEIWRNALLHSYDALLLRRHGQRSYRFLRNVFAGVNVGPFYGVTVMALVLLVDGVAASFISLSFDYVVPWLLLVLILCAVYIAGVLGCAIYLRVPLRLWPRYVSSVITYVIGSAFGRAMGSWKFRTLIV
jgi:GT2 family glycosyltransferase